MKTDDSAMTSKTMINRSSRNLDRFNVLAMACLQCVMRRVTGLGSAEICIESVSMVQLSMLSNTAVKLGIDFS